MCGVDENYALLAQEAETTENESCGNQYSPGLDHSSGVENHSKAAASIARFVIPVDGIRSLPLVGICPRNTCEAFLVTWLLGY